MINTLLTLAAIISAAYLIKTWAYPKLQDLFVHKYFEGKMHFSNADKNFKIYLGCVGDTLPCIYSRLTQENFKGRKIVASKWKIDFYTQNEYKSDEYGWSDFLYNTIKSGQRVNVEDREQIVEFVRKNLYAKLCRIFVYEFQGGFYTAAFSEVTIAKHKSIENLYRIAMPAVLSTEEFALEMKIDGYNIAISEVTEKGYVKFSDERFIKAHTSWQDTENFKNWLTSLCAQWAKEIYTETMKHYAAEIPQG